MGQIYVKLLRISKFFTRKFTHSPNFIDRLNRFYYLSTFKIKYRTIYDFHRHYFAHKNTFFSTFRQKGPDNSFFTQK